MRPRGLPTLVLTLLLAGVTAAPAAAWVEPLERQLAALDAQAPGTLGVYVRHLGEGRSLSYNADRPWYLSSTVKIPVAIALLQKVEAGELSLDDELTLRESDYVDGAGELLWRQPGSRHDLAELLRFMLEESDSTATDMLIRLIGEDELHRLVQAMAPPGFGRFTTILQVRYDAYAELHPGVDELSNMDFVRLHSAPLGERRLHGLIAKLAVSPQELQADSIHEAFERYYRRGLNSGTLTAFGGLLERLVRGELLSPAHTALLLEHMENINTGDDRIRAGLPPRARFAQKTGTQVARACNVGLLQPQSEGAGETVAVAACVERYAEVEDAEALLAAVGEALTAAGLVRAEAPP